MVMMMMVVLIVVVVIYLGATNGDGGDTVGEVIPPPSPFVIASHLFVPSRSHPVLDPAPGHSLCSGRFLFVNFFPPELKSVVTCCHLSGSKYFDCQGTNTIIKIIQQSIKQCIGMIVPKNVKNQMFSI